MRQLSAIRKALLHEMERISEDTWCAGWFSGIEFGLWNEMQGGKGCGGGTVNCYEQDDLDLLRELATLAEGWWRWDEGQGDNVFVPMDEWLSVVTNRTPRHAVEKEQRNSSQPKPPTP